MVSKVISRKQTSLRDVARRAGVSHTTASFVLNGRTDQAIPEETQRRVRQVASDMGYKRNRLAGGILRGKTGLLGVMLPAIEHSHYSSILSGINLECVESDYRLVLAHSRYDPNVEAAEVGRLMEHRVDGLIQVSGDWTLPAQLSWLDEVTSRHLPCAIVEETLFTGHVNTVASDDMRGATLAMRHLLDLGHRRIAHISGYRGVSTGNERCAGYLNAMLEAGLAEHTQVVGDSFAPEKCAAEIRALICQSLSARPTAVFAGNDYLAAAVLAAASEQGLNVPADLAVVGYSDVRDMVCLNMTTVSQQPQEMGRAAVRAVLESQQFPDREPQTTRIEPVLIIRGSCGQTYSIKRAGESTSI